MINTEIQIQIQRSSTGRLTNVIEDYDNDNNDSEHNNDEDELTLEHKLTWWLFLFVPIKVIFDALPTANSRIVMRRQNIFRIENALRLYLVFCWWLVPITNQLQSAKQILSPMCEVCELIWFRVHRSVGTTVQGFQLQFLPCSPAFSAFFSSLTFLWNSSNTLSLWEQRNLADFHGPQLFDQI